MAKAKIQIMISRLICQYLLNSGFLSKNYKARVYSGASTVPAKVKAA